MHNKVKKSHILAAVIFNVIPFVWSTDRIRFALLLVGRLLESCHPVGQIYLTQRLVEEISQLIAGDTNQIRSAMFILGLQALLFISQQLLQSAGHVWMFEVKQKAQFKADRMIADKCSRLEYIYYEQPQYYDRLQRVTQGLAGRSLSIIDHLFQLLQGAFTIISLLFLLANLHVALAVGMVALTIPVFLVHMRLGNRRYRQMLGQTTTSRRMHNLMGLMTRRESAKEMKTFGLHTYISERWSQLFWRNSKEQVHLEKLGALHNLFAELISYSVTLFSGLYLIIAARQGNLSLGQFVALTQAVVTAKGQVTLIAVHLASVYENALFANELFAFLQLAESPPTPTSPSELPMTQLGLEVSNLSFVYPGQQEPILKDITFRILPGQKVAVVGHNGAGKSTLIKCLLGLYKLHHGGIFWNGIAISDIEQYEKKVSVVFQDFVHYPLTVRENIGFGDISALHNDTRLEMAAAHSGALEYIRKLPLSFETELIPEYDGGRELSQGQWQKIALSRSFFNTEAEIVIYDEPTAALDPLAEATLFEQFSELSDGKTSIMISHRLGSCRHADVILVMEDGRLIEQGTHETLMATQGIYANMFKTQSRWYEPAQSNI